MSTRYPGGVITKTPVVPAGPYETGAAPGIWTLDQQLQAAKAGIWPTAGLQPNYIEDVFSTYLVKPTTSNTTYSVTNGIDVSGKGGMVWMKARSAASTNNLVYDTVRGASSIANNALITNSTSAQQTANFDYITGLSNGFTVNFASGGGQLTNNGIDYVSWTFREQPKFFDIVTYTGNGAGSQPVAHNLGSAPGFILCKATSTTDNWAVYHRGNGTTEYTTLSLNLTTAAGFAGSLGTVNAATFNAAFVLDASGVQANASGVTYVAYLFAHNAGGFGLTGTDNVISCGSFTTGSTGDATVNLGYEPQWVLSKRVSGAQSWRILDTMRSFSMSEWAQLNPNESSAESSFSASTYPDGFIPTSTGFKTGGSFLFSSSDYIYIAIRRGPMKVPTSGTSVFTPIARTGTGATATVTGVGFPPDLGFSKSRNGLGGRGASFMDRLRGAQRDLDSSSTSSEATATDTLSSFNMDGVTLGADTYTAQWNYSSNANIEYFLRRAPGFFDEVCYTGTGSAMTISHNLSAAPELIILKERNASGGWIVYSSPTGFSVGGNLAGTGAFSGGLAYVSASTSTTFTALTNATTWVAYLFATVAGVSKVGSYTGNGTTQTINCGFGAGGVRFVLIKRTDAAGGWYVYDTARGMTALTDPYLFLNSSAAETATLGSVTTVSTGFALNSAILADINISAGTYIFFAVS